MLSLLDVVLRRPEVASAAVAARACVKGEGLIRRGDIERVAEFERLVGLVSSDAEIARVFPPSALRAALLAIVGADDIEPTEVRFQELASIKGRFLHALARDEDVEVMRAALSVGQVWLRRTSSPVTSWPWRRP
jgi:hypothetical protein